MPKIVFPIIEAVFYSFILLIFVLVFFTNHGGHHALPA